MAIDPNSETEIKNFDPKRTAEHVSKYVPVDIFKEGVKVGTILIPEDQLTGDIEQDKKYVLQQYNIFDWAGGVISREKLRDPVMLGLFINGLTEIITLYITANLLFVFFERLSSESGIESVKFLVNDPNEKSINIADLTTDDLLNIQKPAYSIFKPTIKALLEEEAEEAALNIWIHVFAETRREIEEDLTTEAIFSMSDSEFDDLFHDRILKTNGNFIDPLLMYSQRLARVALQAINPAGIPLEKICTLLGAEVMRNGGDKNSTHAFHPLAITAELNFPLTPSEWGKMQRRLIEHLPLTRVAPKSLIVQQTCDEIRIEYKGIDGSECTIIQKGGGFFRLPQD